jgi:hypothetical protein
MSGPNCHNCVYSVCDPELWLRWMWMGVPIVPRCANHPWYPGQLHDVSGVVCRNYRRKPTLPQGDSVRMIPLGDGFYAYVDAADYEWLSRWTWHVYGDGYAGRREKGKFIAMHREIMQPPKGMLVDHIDANKANNCRFNLRVCTYAENQHNKRKQHGAVSRFKGVTYSKRYDKWCAHCRTKGEPCHVGYYDDEVEAARAYDRAAVERFGEFARLNFPNEWPPERRAQVHALYQASSVEREGKGKRTKKRKSDAQRAAHDAQRSRKKPKRQSKKPHAETPRRRATKRRTHDATRTTKSVRATAPKGPKRKTQGSRRKTKTKTGRQR